MRSFRFRLHLPLAFGGLALVLTAWEFHNERVIEAMGMAWDTGPPTWPYQTSWILLESINAPAYVLGLPLYVLFGARSVHEKLPLMFPTILLWWWFIGWRIDFGLLPKRTVRRRLWGTGVGLISLLLWCFFTYLLVEQMQFWPPHGFFIRDVGYLCWSLLLGIWSAWVAVRLATPSWGQSAIERKGVTPG